MIRIKSDLVLKQFVLNTMILLLNEISLIKGVIVTLLAGSEDSFSSTGKH